MTFYPLTQIARSLYPWLVWFGAILAAATSTLSTSPLEPVDATREPVPTELSAPEPAGLTAPLARTSFQWLKHA